MHIVYRRETGQSFDTVISVSPATGAQDWSHDQSTWDSRPHQGHGRPAHQTGQGLRVR